MKPWTKLVLSFSLIHSQWQSNIHYENTPVQIYRKFHLQKLKTFLDKIFDIFHISAQNIYLGYSLEPPRRGGSNEYPKSIFLSRNMKNNVYPCKPQFYYIKVGFKGGGQNYIGVFSWWMSFLCLYLTENAYRIIPRCCRRDSLSSSTLSDNISSDTTRQIEPKFHL